MRERLGERAKGIPADLAALAIALRHPETPWYAKALALAVIAYAASPIDLIPDFIPFVGYLDDLIIVPGGIALVARLIPRRVWEESRRKASPAAAGAMRWIRRLGIGMVLAIWTVVALAITGVICWIVRKG